MRELPRQRKAAVLQLSVNDSHKDCIFYVDCVFLVLIENELFSYEFVLESVIRYGLSTWYRNLQTAMKLTGQKDFTSIQSLFEQCTLKEARRVLSMECCF